MPITFPDFRQGEAAEASSIPSTRTNVLTEQFAQVFEENPVNAFMRWNDLRIDQKTGPRLDAKTARDRLTASGLQNELKVDDSGITEAALETLMERKRTELRRADVYARAQGGLAEGAQRFGVAALTSLADPIGAGLNFVPVVGQTRYLSMMSRANFAKRIAIRSGVGAAEGTVGAAIAEIPVSIMRNSEQADYGMADALLNVSLGGVTGGGLHATVGTSAEGVDLLRGRTSEYGLYRDLNNEQIRALRAAPAATRQALAQAYKAAPAAKAEFDSLVSAIGKDVGAEVLLAKLKGVPRALEKTLADYRGDVTQLRDMVRGTLVVDSLEAAAKAVAAVKAKFGNVTKLRDKLSDSSQVRPDGYRDININATVRGQAVELQINVREMMEAKDGPGHKLYEKQRTIEARAAKEGRELPAAEVEELLDLTRQQRELYQAAWTRFEARSRNADSETSSPLWTKDEYGKERPSATSQAVQETPPGARETGTPSTSANSVPSGNLAGRAISTTSGRIIPVDPEVRDFDLTAAEKAGLASPEAREAALRAGVGQAVSGRQVNVDPFLTGESAENAFTAALATNRGAGSTPDPEFAAATARAEEVAAAPAVTDELKVAQEEADLAMADAQALAKRLDLTDEDPELAAADELVETAERWAKAAEVATTCLIRGS
jgi:hypothetical protein